MDHTHTIKVFSCRGSQHIAERIAQALKLELGKSEVTVFSDGEFQPAFNESVRGATVFIVQSTYPPVENLFELLLMIDAAKRASAYKVIAVMPYFGWARQDRKDRPRVSIGAKMVANMLAAAGCDRVMTVDLHADQIQGFFDFPVDHIGDVEGRNVVIVDDMVDTAGTLCKAANMLMEKGAKSVRALATHAVLSGAAYENIKNSQLTELIVTDTIPLRPGEGADTSKIKVITIADLIGDVIDKVYNYQSITPTFVF